MTLRTVVIEDNEGYRNTFKQYLSTLTTIKYVGDASSKKAGVELIRRKTPDLVILDIELPNEGEGFELLSEFGGNISFDVIIITGYDKADYFDKYEDINSSLPDSVIKLLLKKHFERDNNVLEKRINKIINNRKHPNIIALRRQELQCLLTNTSGDHREIICLRNDINEEDKIETVALKDIVYIQSDEQYQYIFTSDGLRFVVRYSMSGLEELLSKYGFIRTSKSYLANIRYVKKVSKEEKSLYLLYGELIPIPISRRKLETVLERLNDFDKT